MYKLYVENGPTSIKNMLLKFIEPISLPSIGNAMPTLCHDAGFENLDKMKYFYQHRLELLISNLICITY